MSAALRTKSRWFVKTFLTLLLLSPVWIAGLLWWEIVSGGDLFDRFDVISSSASPDGRSIAVLYRYKYAELSMEGYSVWLQPQSEPVASSRSGWPAGDVAFTALNMEAPKFTWNQDGEIEILASTSTIVRSTKMPDGCFWEHGAAAGSYLLCVHSDRVFVRIE